MATLHRTGSRARAVGVVCALACVGGAALGLFIATGLLVGGLVFIQEKPSVSEALGLLGIGVATGGGLGLALGPLTAFGLLRAVPLGRAITTTAIGAASGLTLTVVLGSLLGIALSPFVSVPAGFFSGALFARWRHSRPSAPSMIGPSDSASSAPHLPPG